MSAVLPVSTLPSWLLDSDPSIRWQVLRDLTDAPPETVAAERSRIATEGWGAARPHWPSNLYTLVLLRDLDLDPMCEQARAAVALVRERVAWADSLSSP